MPRPRRKPTPFGKDAKFVANFATILAVLFVLALGLWLIFGGMSAGGDAV